MSPLHCNFLKQTTRAVWVRFFGIFVEWSRAAFFTIVGGKNSLGESSPAWRQAASTMLMSISVYLLLHKIFSCILHTVRSCPTCVAQMDNLTTLL
jgi:hypothetical protein